MKPVDDMAFNKRKATREGNNDKSDNFEMEILDEGALNKVLIFPDNNLDPPPGRQFMR